MEEIAQRLTQHLRQTAVPAALARIIGEVAVAGKLIARDLCGAALAGTLGDAGTFNVQGEAQKKLDVWANDVVMEALRSTGVVGVVVSEEEPEPVRLGDGPYLVCIDPVDGSANLDINGIVGTIFSVRPRRGTSAADVAADVVEPGSAQVAAGYIMYGASTVLVLSTGRGVAGFTLVPAIGEYVCSHPAMRVPGRGRIFSINDANAPRWEPGVAAFLDHLRTRGTGRAYTARYVGSMVADLHRTLIEGGIFLYPAEVTTTGLGRGKLRLQYEAAPMAFLVEQAGGRASTGHGRILDVRPRIPHERVPVVIGSEEDVRLCEDFIAGRR